MNTTPLPLISVIVPMYNVEKYISQCIESILKQTYQNIEIILVDDCSSDKTGIIADHYSSKNDHINVIHKEKNEGVSAARNSGIDVASGEYLCFVDGDDYVDEEYVKYLYSLIEKNGTVVSVSTHWYTSYDRKQNQVLRNCVISGIEATERILCYRIPIGVNNKLFQKCFLEKHHLRFIKELPIGEGFNFNIAVFQRAEFVAEGNKKVYYYRKDNDNSVTTKFNMRKWELGIYALERIKYDMIVKSEKVAKAWKYAFWRTNTDAYDVMILSKSLSKYPEFYKKIMDNIRAYRYSFIGVPISSKDRLRAVIMTVFPIAIPAAMIIRKSIKRVNVNYKSDVTG